MKIISRVKKFPGGFMVCPLILGEIINTFSPSILEIGSFTTAIFSSYGISLFCLGTNF